MIDVVVTYDRTAAVTIEAKEFNDHRQALQYRLEREIYFRERTDVEVVLLRAASREDLRRSHSRYFAPELIDPDTAISEAERFRNAG